MFFQLFLYYCFLATLEVFWVKITSFPVKFAWKIQQGMSQVSSSRRFLLVYCRVHVYEYMWQYHCVFCWIEPGLPFPQFPYQEWSVNLSFWGALALWVEGFSKCIMVSLCTVVLPPLSQQNTKQLWYFFVLRCRDVFFIILNSSCTYHGVRATLLQDEK